MAEENLTRKELFKIAARLFREKGYKATSMQDIARELGIQKPSLYYYITSKEDLLKEIGRVTMGMLIKEIERIAFSPCSSKEKIEMIISSHLKLIAEHIELFTVSLREINPINARSFWDEVVALRDKYESYVRGILRVGRESGEFRKDLDEKLTGFALLGMLNWSIRWFSPTGGKTPEEIARAWIELFLNGILAQKEEKADEG
jgi:AcrR family transcriptional regulator